jgi:hypothetical protein
MFQSGRYQELGLLISPICSCIHNCKNGLSFNCRVTQQIAIRATKHSATNLYHYILLGNCVQYANVNSVMADDIRNVLNNKRRGRET